MIDPEKIQHVVPVNDLKEHIVECIFPPIGDLYCNCECKPRIEEAGTGLIVVHNSFDGRENFELDNKIHHN